MANLEELRAIIQERLRQALEDAERLSAALDALAPDQPPPRPRSQRATRDTVSPTARRGAGGRRSIRQVILEELADGQAMTAGEVAQATGRARGSLSTRLSELVGEGVLVKIPRGYSLPAAPRSSPAEAPGETQPSGDRALRAMRRELNAGLRTRRQ